MKNLRRELLAPPVISGANYDKERLKQAKYADVLSCDGLASSAGGATVILTKFEKVSSC